MSEKEREREREREERERVKKCKKEMSRVARKLDLQRTEKRQEWRNFVEKLEISSGNEKFLRGHGNKP